MHIPGRRYRYQDPEATMTLREGLSEYKAANPELLDPEDFDNPKVGELFACHDPCHVVFGTNTDLVQEGMTDFWTIWGADIGFKGYWAYVREPGTTDALRDIMKQFTLWQLSKDVVRSLPYYWRVWRHSKRLKHKWPFYDWRDHLDTPLGELRSHYGIELVEPPPIRVHEAVS